MILQLGLGERTLVGKCIYFVTNERETGLVPGLVGKKDATEPGAGLRRGTKA